ncbi:hypothetical protein OG21DRAFT_1501980 [Imleria badia]|nr:hypothetical protein OG21DRAFT_1501980 [Imleria badia]
MFILMESTLFFINLMHSSPRGRNHKAEALSKVNQWTSHVKNAQTQYEPVLHNPSISMATLVPQSSVATQSTGATSVNNEYCDVAMDEEPTYSAFGEDGDDAEEQLEAEIAGRGRQQLVEFTEVPACLQDQAGVLKCKGREEDDSNHAASDILAHTLEDYLSGVDSGHDTESDGETMEDRGNEDCHVKSTSLTGRRLTAASRLTNRSCINVLEPPPPKKVKSVPTNRKVTETPSKSTAKAAAQLMRPLPATSIAPPAGSNSGPRHFTKGNLPAELLVDRGTDDVWSISRPAIVYALPLMIDSREELDSSTMDFTTQGAIVSVAYQRLCDWRHNVGSTAMAIIMSFLQCADTDDEIRDMADMLLDDFSFLYKDLDASSLKKAFQSNFLLQLLNAAHLQCVNGAIAKSFVTNVLSPPLQNYSGIISLCGAALERALHMASEGHITHKMIEALGEKRGEDSCAKGACQGE